MQVCFGSPFQIQPSETVSRDELACLLVKSIRAGATENLSGSIDKFSDEGASKWTNEINVLAANDVIPACSDLSDKFCPSRKITIGEVSYIVNRLVEKSLIPTSVFDVNPFQAGWAANGGEVTEASSTAVSNPCLLYTSPSPRD